MDLVQSAVSTNKTNTNRYKVLISELQKLIFVPFSMQNDCLFFFEKSNLKDVFDVSVTTCSRFIRFFSIKHLKKSDAFI